MDTESISPTIIIPKKNIIMDSQILSSLMACPRLTDFRFNHDFQSNRGKSKSLEMGSIVHTGLEFYYQNIINGISRPDSENFGLTAALDYSNSEECNTATEDERSWAIKTIEEYFLYYKNDSWTPLEVEIVKGEIIYEDDEVRIMWKAKLDLLVDTNQGIYPVDHKTMSQRRDTTNLNNQFTGQCILANTRLMFVNKIGFQKTLKPSERFTRAPINYSYDRLLEWQSITVPYYAKLLLMYQESGFWPPNLTHCENKYGFCTFKEVCESDRNMREQVLGQNFIVGRKWDVTNPEKKSADE